MQCLIILFLNSYLVPLLMICCSSEAALSVHLPFHCPSSIRVSVSRFTTAYQISAWQSRTHCATLVSFKRLSTKGMFQVEQAVGIAPCTRDYHFYSSEASSSSTSPFSPKLGLCGFIRWNGVKFYASGVVTSAAIATFAVLAVNLLSLGYWAA